MLSILDSDRYDEGGQLTDAVRRRPYSVLLFDEMEKAHPFGNSFSRAVDMAPAFAIVETHSEVFLRQVYRWVEREELHVDDVVHLLEAVDLDALVVVDVSPLLLGHSEQVLRVEPPVEEILNDSC